MCRLVILLTLFTSAAWADFNKSIERAKHISGDKVTAGDLKGKVILLEYWGQR